MKKIFSRLAIAFDQSFSHSVLSQFKWLGGVVVIAFVTLMVLSHFLYDSQMDDDGSRGLIVDTIMLLFDPGCMTDRMNDWYVIITALCGIIIFMGMFIPIVSNVLERRTDAVLNGAVSYDLANHHIILGYNKSVPSLINYIRLKMKDNAYILIMSEQPSEDVRARLTVSLGQNVEKRVVILNGKRNMRDDLERLSLSDAKSLWIIGEENEEGHDSINFECAQMVAQLRREKLGTKELEDAIREKDELSAKYWGVGEEEQKNILERKTEIFNTILARMQLECHVMFDQPTIYSCFQYSDVTPEMRNYLDFLPFNPYENWAKKVLVAGPEKKEENKHYTPLDGENGIRKDSDKHVHLIIIGMSRMGQALAVEAAHTAHFFNFREDNADTRTHITFIDCNAEEEVQRFKSRFEGMFELAMMRYADAATDDINSVAWTDPLLRDDSRHKHLGENFIDVKWEFINGGVDSPAVRRYLAASATDIHALTTIAVCLPDAEESLRIALSMPYQTYDCQQILVYQDVYSALLNNLSANKKKGNIRQFGAMSDYYEENKVGEEEGKWINFFYVDNSLASVGADILWKDEKVINQWSSIHSANILYTKLRSVGLTTADSDEAISKAFEQNMDDLMVMEHNRWNVDKLLTGFRALTDGEHAAVKAGKVKKNQLKNEEFAHLDICSFAQLREDDASTIQSDIDVTRALVTILKQKVK